ncbi:MAG: serine/threonine-protein kinase [Planctomycetota bacterium]|nr:serine/threonine-protein kinase [Planctomycetota bacterium]
MAEMTQSNTDALLAKALVDQGLATAADVEQCQALQREGGDADDISQQSLAALLVANGVVTQRQVDRIRPLVEEPKGGQQIPGYQILDRLGAGAMATVYRARQLSLDRLVAIKILPRKQTNNPQFVERFYAEGKAAAKLNHPNIVGALDVGKAGEFHYFVMEYVEGWTVYDDIVKKGAYSEADALRIIMQISNALDHAQKAGFIHRDVKPKNIMITSQGVAKLADMGLARAVSDREAAEAEAGKAYGTPYYISPEQIRGEKDVDFRADIYGLGATLYHMVTGQVPFDAPNPSAVMHKHLKAPLVPPDHINSRLSSGLCEIIEVCMAKNRDERYNTFAELTQDLEAVARGEPPLQARRKFDLASLASLEKSVDGQAIGHGGENQAGGVTTVIRDVPIVEQPMFWLALAGWALSIVLVVLVIVLAVR